MKTVKEALKRVEKTFANYSGATLSAMSYRGADLDRVHSVVGGKISTTTETLKSEPGYPGGTSTKNTFCFPAFKVEAEMINTPSQPYVGCHVYIRINGKRYLSGLKIAYGYKKDGKEVSMNYGLMIGEKEKLEKYFFVTGIVDPVLAK